MYRLSFVFAFAATFLIPLKESSANAIKDTVIAYDVKTATESFILPIDFDPAVLSDRMDYSIGSLGNKIDLIQTQPTKNLYPGSSFAKPDNADKYYDVLAYPVRTAVKLYVTQNNQPDCSGVLIAENFVLTSAHCVLGYWDGSVWNDGLLVAPGFNNGQFQSLLDSSTVKTYFIFKRYINKNGTRNVYNSDIALLELEKPIGKKTGWVSMAFYKDTSYYRGKVFHKFSYPGKSMFGSAEFNADTLDYNFGAVDYFAEKNQIGARNALGYPGQSGSEWLYTDNKNIYETVAVSHYSNNHVSQIISPEYFYAFKDIINKRSVGINEVENVDKQISIYPNPVNDVVTLKTRQRWGLSFVITSISGLDVFEGEITEQEASFNLSKLQPGVYILQFKSGTGYIQRKKLIISR